MKRAILSFVVMSLAYGSASYAANDVLWQRYTDEGNNAKKDGNLTEAETFYRAALERADKLHSTDDVLRTSYQNLADTKYLHGHYADAVPLFKKAIDSYNSELKRMTAEKIAVSEKLVKEQMNLADCYRADGKYKLAEAAYRDALKTLDSNHDDNKLMRAHVQSELGDTLCIEAKYSEAEAVYKEALPVLEKYNATDILVDLLQDYDALMRATNRTSEAERLEGKLAAIRQQEIKAVNSATSH
ncbi:MAG TPA: tetratricopeptide repeat protein [Planktothrix sp.]|jgi:tetratricopeptide (TPR) repeat protein